MQQDAQSVGEKVRREVLGDEYVDAMKPADEFMNTLSTYVTESCWGGAWARPGLDRRARSIVTVAVLAALGRWEELQTHAGGAMRNGLTADELAEVLVHVGTYAGVPCAVAGFRAAAPAVARATEADSAS